MARAATPRDADGTASTTHLGDRSAAGSVARSLRRCGASRWSVSAGLVALLLTGCGSSGGPGRDAVLAGSPRPSSTSAPTDQSSPTPTPTPSPTPTPTRTEPPDPWPDLPGALTRGGVEVQTGGVYEDYDGFKEKLTITLFEPVVLTAADETKLDAVCPDSQFSSDIVEHDLTADGGLAQAFIAEYSPQSRRYPFPLADYLATAEGQSSATSAALSYGGVNFNYRSAEACAVSSDDSSARFVGFATVLPAARRTPKNPDGRLPGCDLYLVLEDPLYDLGGMNWSVVNWVREPDTAYGPSGLNSLESGWRFPVAREKFADICPG